jgi:hypothetical protein
VRYLIAAKSMRRQVVGTLAAAVKAIPVRWVGIVHL